MPSTLPPSRATESRRPGNLRVALILGSIALVFFGGVIVSHVEGESDIGMTVLGIAIIGFLLLTVGRKVMKGRRE